MARIPERNPLGDAFTGLVIQSNGAQALTVTSQPDVEIVANGTFVVRYGVRYLGKPYLSIVPGLIALDYGTMLTGEAAWDFLLQRSNLHPRADVIGFRNDGVDEMVVVKQLDIMQPVAVLVYPDAQATKPIAQPTAFVGATEAMPPRLLDYLPSYATLDEWKAALNERS